MDKRAGHAQDVTSECVWSVEDENDSRHQVEVMRKRELKLLCLFCRGSETPVCKNLLASGNPLPIINYPSLNINAVTFFLTVRGTLIARL